MVLILYHINDRFFQQYSIIYLKSGRDLEVTLVYIGIQRNMQKLDFICEIPWNNLRNVWNIDVPYILYTLP